MPARSREFALLAAVLAAPLTLRTALLLDDDLVPALIDLRGIAGDIVVGGLFAVALGGLMRWSRVGVGIALGAWTLACYANYEHVLALDANAALAEDE